MSLTIVYSIVSSDANQRKHQISASLAFVWGIHRGPVNSPHKWPVTRKRFPFDDVIMLVVNNNIMNYFSKCDMLSSRMFANSVRNYSQVHKQVFKQRMRYIKRGIGRFLSSAIIRMSITVTKYKISKLILDFIQKSERKRSSHGDINCNTFLRTRPPRVMLSFAILTSVCLTKQFTESLWYTRVESRLNAIYRPK